MQEYILSGFFDEMDKIAKTVDLIAGGKAEGKPAADFPADQLRMGIKIEHEHTPSKQIAEEIAKDHLSEFRNYYTGLKNMEHQLELRKEQEKRANGDDDEDDDSVDKKKRTSEESILTFFRKNPNPVDEQVHEFAEANQMSPHTLETQIYKILSGQLEKKAALGVDLRTNGPGNIKRPPFPTEDSKVLPFSKFKQSRAVGQSQGVKPATPAIRSVATKV